MSRKLTAKQLYRLKNDYMKSMYEQVSPRAFYRDVFPEGTLERRGFPDDNKPNAIFTSIVCKDDKRKYAANTIVFDDLKELEAVQGSEFAVSSPISYSGKYRTAKNAYHLWGIAIDLDGVTMDTLGDLIHQINNDLIPEPTYIVNSGNGLHLYFLFEEPIPLYSYLEKPLKDLKHALTDVVWNQYTSTIETEKKQFQGIYQGFRMPGTQSKLGKRYPVVAFKTGKKRTLRYLNDYVDERYKVSNYDEFKHLTLDQAKELYPEWYKRRIVNGVKSGRWVCHRALYDWWIRQIKKGAFDGNRYNCIAVLVTMAVKCDIPKDEVLNDALELVPFLNSLTAREGNQFTEQDVYDAFTYYDDSYVNYSISAIEARTNIKIERNVRNGRKMDSHQAYRRAIKKFKQENGEADGWDKGGRPSASEKVKSFKLNHPDATKADCIRVTGLSKPTVYKWWNGSDIAPKTVARKTTVDVPENILTATRVVAEMMAKMTPEQREEIIKLIDELET